MRSKCGRELYEKFLKITASRYSALSLSEVSPKELSHDSISRWLEEAEFKPKEIWEKSKDYVSWLAQNHPNLIFMPDNLP